MAYEKFLNLNDEKHGRIIKSVVGMDRAKFNKLAEAFASAEHPTEDARRTAGDIARCGAA